jgi:hypothetical protein
MKSLMKGFGREKKVRIHWSRQLAHRWRLGYQFYTPASTYPQILPRKLITDISLLSIAFAPGLVAIQNLTDGLIKDQLDLC